MDLGNILLWTVIVLFCVVPFILLARSAKKRKQQSLQALQEFAAEHQANIKQHDQWLNSAIGLDEQAGLLFFINIVQGIPTKQWVKLSEVQKCTVNDQSRIVDGQKVIDRIELLLSTQGSNRTLVFFNVNAGSLTPTLEFQLADKWCKIINEQAA